MSSTEKRPPGPDPEHLKVEGDWEGAVDKALKKKRPKGGWPKPDGKKPTPEPDDPEEDPEV